MKYRVLATLALLIFKFSYAQDFTIKLLVDETAHNFKQQYCSQLPQWPTLENHIQQEYLRLYNFNVRVETEIVNPWIADFTYDAGITDEVSDTIHSQLSETYANIATNKTLYIAVIPLRHFPKADNYSNTLGEAPYFSNHGIAGYTINYETLADFKQHFESNYDANESLIVGLKQDIENPGPSFSPEAAQKFLIQLQNNSQDLLELIKNTSYETLCPYYFYKRLPEIIFHEANHMFGLPHHSDKTNSMFFQAATAQKNYTPNFSNFVLTQEQINLVSYHHSFGFMFSNIENASLKDYHSSFKTYFEFLENSNDLSLYDKSLLGYTLARKALEKLVFPIEDTLTKLNLAQNFYDFSKENISNTYFNTVILSYAALKSFAPPQEENFYSLEVFTISPSESNILTFEIDFTYESDTAAKKEFIENYIRSVFDKEHYKGTDLKYIAKSSNDSFTVLMTL